MWINDKDLREYSGKLLADYKVSGCELDISVVNGRKRSSFNLLNATVGLKTLTISIEFSGSDRADASLKKSMFEKIAFGKSELVMDDGLLYSVVLSKIGDTTYIGQELIKVEYTFTGVRHGERVKTEGNIVYCDSTLLYTDCILTATATDNADFYSVGSVTFKNVSAGEILTVDGINGRILVNGIPAAERADWIEFPKLVPGKNILQCDDVLTVEFYPAYF